MGISWEGKTKSNQRLAAPAIMHTRDSASQAAALEMGIFLRRATPKVHCSLIAAEVTLEAFHELLLTWRGHPEAVQFQVAVPTGIRLGAVVGKVTVSLDGTPVAGVQVPLGHVITATATSPGSDTSVRSKWARVRVAEVYRTGRLSSAYGA